MPVTSLSCDSPCRIAPCERLSLKLSSVTGKSCFKYNVRRCCDSCLHGVSADRACDSRWREKLPVSGVYSSSSSVRQGQDLIQRYMTVEKPDCLAAGPVTVTFILRQMSFQKVDVSDVTLATLLSLCIAACVKGYTIAPQ